MWRGGKTLDYTSEMRQFEFRAVADMMGLDSSRIEFHDGISNPTEIGSDVAEAIDRTRDPRLWQFLRGMSIEEARQVAPRCAVVRQLHEVIAFGSNAKECAEAAAAYPLATHPRAAGLALGDTWRMRWMQVRQVEEKQRSRPGKGRAPFPPSLLDDLAIFTDKLPGKVDLARPQHVLYVLDGAFSMPSKSSSLSGACRGISCGCGLQRLETLASTAPPYDTVEISRLFIRRRSKSRRWHTSLDINRGNCGARYTTVRPQSTEIFVDQHDATRSGVRNG
jgi:hypothetical protein